MQIYNVKFYDDMGHLMMVETSNKIIPQKIHDFIWTKSKLYINVVNNSRFRSYVLKSGLNKNWQYYCNNDVINITYDLQ